MLFKFIKFYSPDDSVGEEPEVDNTVYPIEFNEYPVWEEYNPLMSKIKSTNIDLEPSSV